MALPMVVREPPIGGPFRRVSPPHRLADVPPDHDIHTNSVPTNALMMHATSPAALLTLPPKSIDGSINSDAIPTVGLSSRSVSGLKFFTMF